MKGIQLIYMNLRINLWWSEINWEYKLPDKKRNKVYHNITNIAKRENERPAIRPYILKIRSQNFGVIPPNRRWYGTKYSYWLVIISSHGLYSFLPISEAGTPGLLRILQVSLRNRWSTLRLSISDMTDRVRIFGIFVRMGSDFSHFDYFHISITIRHGLLYAPRQPKTALCEYFLPLY